MQLASHIGRMELQAKSEESKKIVFNKMHRVVCDYGEKTQL